METTPLTQAHSHLLYWAKFACEELRAQIGYGTDDEDDIQPPTWLAEMEAAIDAVENEGGEAVEP